MCTASNIQSPSVPALHEEAGSHATHKDLTPGPEKHSKKVVSFHNVVCVYPCLHYLNFTEHEHSDSWYNDQEMDEIKAECIHTLQLVSSENINLCKNNNFWCLRGLEYRTPEGAKKRLENKYLAWDTVMSEQENQFMMGEFNDEAIARTYAKVSAACREEATVLALEDAKTARLHQVTAKIASSRRRRIVCRRNSFAIPLSQPTGA
jgi:hypothetical protein